MAAAFAFVGRSRPRRNGDVVGFTGCSLGDRAELVVDGRRQLCILVLSSYLLNLLYCTKHSKSGTLVFLLCVDDIDHCQNCSWMIVVSLNQLSQLQVAYSLLILQHN